MNLEHTYPVMIFRRDTDTRTFYSLGLSKKKQDGSYENGYIDCQFKKGIELENKTKIYIKDAWLSFYKNKDNLTMPYIFINNFETIEETIEESKEVDPFSIYTEYGESIEIKDDFLD